MNSSADELRRLQATLTPIAGPSRLIGNWKPEDLSDKRNKGMFLLDLADLRAAALRILDACDVMTEALSD